ncbi:hypothetical protein RFI_20428 [Reticulomyxa filosa]|uniref:Dienelactone hydrolase domain-containing protein n=1 Tax=Reticulomyxa filosa TaxID=46433 RepID=X6MSH9_RETFI|nr:hypothetical protein RFI_20428 [Reticulomyxa filosa]|eukprot:ETO16908.1 hypothetical protein RFI_20428 [Reticulomyxa filosa]
MQKLSLKNGQSSLWKEIKKRWDTTFDYVRNNWETLQVDRKRIYLFGRSLGGAVAIYLASQHSNELAGVILENTFTCISDMVKKVFRFLDFDIIKKYMLRLEWRSIDLINQITCPILFLASGRDEIVPSEQMVELHRSASSAHFKSWHSIPQAMHNDAWLSGGDDYWKEIRAFVEECENKANKKTDATD